ncbi:MAG: hypothetical protein LBN43_02685, partial [Oscillospiraceae bacterium]|nr:hypothetical protein [Oscillospiraceae bacterium]
MQKTQKTLALLMAIVLVIALFAACSGSGDTGVTTDAPAATSTQAAAPTATPAPTEGTETEPPEETNILQPAPAELPRAGDNLAVDSSGNRKYEVDGKYPTSYYEYELPLTTSMGDDTFSIFTFLFDDTYLNGE